jgi:hypothetical protein
MSLEINTQANWDTTNSVERTEIAAAQIRSSVGRPIVDLETVCTRLVGVKVSTTISLTNTTSCSSSLTVHSHLLQRAGMEKGVTYNFIQEDFTNYYHALGFAYYADGALDDQPELEPGVS